MLFGDAYFNGYIVNTNTLNRPLFTHTWYTVLLQYYVLYMSNVYKVTSI